MKYNPEFMIKNIVMVAAAVAAGALVVWQTSEHGDLLVELSKEEDYENPPVGFTS